jgi:hypothetical protein
MEADLATIGPQQPLKAVLRTGERKLCKRPMARGIGRGSGDHDAALGRPAMRGHLPLL